MNDIRIFLLTQQNISKYEHLCELFLAPIFMKTYVFHLHSTSWNLRSIRLLFTLLITKHFE